MKLRLIAVGFTYITLAAHFSRADILPLSILALLIPFLLLIKKRWSLVTIQIIAYCGAVEWLRFTVIMVQQRMDLNQDWARMVIILSVVMLFTFWTGFSLNNAAVKERYPK